MFDIDLKSRTPIYEQLYKKIIELIINGILTEGSQIPSVRGLAKDIGVNPNTVSKAYAQLEREGIIYSLPGKGSFIGSVSGDSIRSCAFTDFDKAVRATLDSGVTPAELKERIDFVCATRKLKEDGSV